MGKWTTRRFKKSTTHFVLLGLFIALIASFFVYYFLQQDWMPFKQYKELTREVPPFTKVITGELDNPLSRPMDVVLVANRLYVTDSSNQQVQVFEKSGKSAFSFGKKGFGEGEFQAPFGITSDGSNIYVADIQTGKISVFDLNGKFKHYFVEKGEKQVLLSPIGIRAYHDKLYVTDVKSNGVFVFNQNGEKILEIYEADGIPLFAPNCITKDDEDNIYVSDSGNNRVVKFDKNGKYLLTINGSTDGKGKSQLVNPRGIGVSKAGVLYFVENQGNMIHGYTLEGKKLFSFGKHGSEETDFYLPNGLFITEEGNLLITETGNDRIDWYN